MPKNNSVFERIAHRGGSREAPENTLPAIELAVQKYHVDRVEVDIRLTKDNVPVIFHDVALERVTNARGLVRTYTLEELKKVDAGFWFDPDEKGKFPFRKKGVMIPTLEELLNQFPDTSFCLEIKEKKPETVPPIAEVIGRAKGSGALIVGSFHVEMVRALRQATSSFAESFLAKDEVSRAQLAFRMGQKKFSTEGARFASLPTKEGKTRLDEPAWIEFLHQNGLKVFYWTINEKEEAEELIRRGADGIMSDYPERLNEILNPKS